MRLIVVAVGVLGILMACYLIGPEWFGFCDTYDRGDGVLVCDSPHQRNIGDPLLYISISFLLCSVFALYLSSKVFRKWLAFSFVYGFIVLVLLTTYRDTGGGMGVISFKFFDIEGFAKLYAGIFAILSLATFFIPDLLSRHKK